MSEHQREISSTRNAEDIIRILGLKKLPEEGGFYRETYKCADAFALARGVRSCGTAIYYLVTAEEFSALHRVSSDEIFHFYAGSPVEMLQIEEDGTHHKIVLGADVFSGQVPQYCVPRGTWQGTKLVNDKGWALLGCTVSPGFEFADFEAGSRTALVKKFPHLKEDIVRFTR